METLRQWQFPTVHRPLGMAAQRHSDSYQRDTECIVFRKAGKALEAMAEWMSCARQSVSSVHDLLTTSVLGKVQLRYFLEKQHALINMKHEVKWDGG